VEALFLSPNFSCDTAIISFQGPNHLKTMEDLKSHGEDLQGENLGLSYVMSSREVEKIEKNIKGVWKANLLLYGFEIGVLIKQLMHLAPSSF
jgi:hypothetical protein